VTEKPSGRAERPERDELFYGSYGHWGDRVLEEIRAETFGEDIGQNSWLTADELDRFLAWLDLKAGSHLLEVASGSGGPARTILRRAGCRVTGIDASEKAVAEATQTAARLNLSERLTFRVADANARLPFDDAVFDALACIDAMNHLLDRARVLAEWRRVLRPGGRAVFTDPVVVTGPVSNDEIAVRGSIGAFLFVPPGVNEELIAGAGLELIRTEDATENEELVARRWREARERRADALRRLEGDARFDGVQRFLEVVHRLTAERRLSRLVYLVQRRR
jgi:SAM-dependent methyltransferase